MKNTPDLVYLGHEQLRKIADQHAFNEYQREQAQTEESAKSLTKYRVLRILREELASLPESYQLLIKLRYWDNLSEAAIAKELKISPAQARRHCALSLGKLRKRIFSQIRRQCRFSLREVACLLDL